MQEKRIRLGKLLVDNGLITEEQLQAGLQKQKETREKLGQILIQLGYINEQELLEVLEYTLDIPRVQLKNIKIEESVIKTLPSSIIRRHKVLPIALKQGRLTLAMADPLNYETLDIIHLLTNLDVTPVLVGEKELETAIQHYTSLAIDPRMEQLICELGPVEINGTALEDSTGLETNEDAPVVRLVNSILKQAVQSRASDIHIEPMEQAVRVRLRMDGELYPILSLPQRSHAALVSRIKIMSNMDISEKRMPQDGRTQMIIEGNDIDFRVSSLPSIYGEKIVMRILDRTNALIELEALGFSKANYAKMVKLINQPHGMLIITGPTGSGKTTTLYSILHKINSVDKNIITLEDPVEYALEGITQVQINTRAGLTFSSGLRSILRQDPNIIMVGEMRDNETAELGVKSALTGHLLLTTLHTNSASGTVARLVNMGVESFLLASALAGVVSQRLVRKLCPNCRQSFALDQETARQLGMDEHAGGKFYRAVGCSMCRHTGYAGRIALYELFAIGPHTRTAINRGVSAEDLLEKEALLDGLITIKQDGIQKASLGLTSLEEVMKAVYLGG